MPSICCLNSQRADSHVRTPAKVGLMDIVDLTHQLNYEVQYETRSTK